MIVAYSTNDFSSWSTFWWDGVGETIGSVYHYMILLNIQWYTFIVYCICNCITLKYAKVYFFEKQDFCNMVASLLKAEYLVIAKCIVLYAKILYR